MESKESKKKGLMDFHVERIKKIIEEVRANRNQFILNLIDDGKDVQITNEDYLNLYLKCEALTSAYFELMFETQKGRENEKD